MVSLRKPFANVNSQMFIMLDKWTYFYYSPETCSVDLLPVVFLTLFFSNTVLFINCL